MTESIRKHRGMRVVKSNDLDADMLQIPPVNLDETICNAYKICRKHGGKEYILYSSCQGSPKKNIRQEIRSFYFVGRFENAPSLCIHCGCPWFARRVSLTCSELDL